MEIKFRAYNPDTKKFEFFHLVHSHSIMTSLPIPSMGKWDNLKPFEQFIGMKDNNKKEVYQGDIVRYADILHIVDFYVHAFVFTDLTGEVKVYNLPSPNFFEIIGNIHQNPEFLK